MTTLNPPARWWVVGFGAVCLLLYLADITGNHLPSAASSHGPPFSSYEANRLSIEELFSRPLSQDLTAVPRLFHQSWSSNELPSRFQHWSQTCREKHPDWEWILWTDEDNLELCKRYFPWFLNTFQALPGPILRADVARGMYMYIFGGIYADLDTECLRDSEELLVSYDVPTVFHPGIFTSQPGNRTAIFGRMGTDNSFSDSVPNAWMAASPGHPFHLLLLEGINDLMHKNNSTGDGLEGVNDWVEGLTGPAALLNQIHRYEHVYSSADNPDALDLHFANNPTTSATQYGEIGQDLPHRVEILPFWYIYPYSWSRDGSDVRDICEVTRPLFNATRCKILLGVNEWPSYTITYWSHTWTREGHDEGHLYDLEN